MLGYSASDKSIEKRILEVVLGERGEKFFFFLNVLNLHTGYHDYKISLSLIESICYPSVAVLSRGAFWDCYPKIVQYFRIAPLTDG